VEQTPLAASDSDVALVSALSRGDATALARLYNRYAPTAYGLAVNLVGSTFAEDVVHDAFVGLIEHPGTFDPARGSFRAWFLTAVHHRCVTLLRGRAKLTIDDSLVELPSPLKEPAEAVLRSLEDDEVRNALTSLTPEQREVLVLAYYGGLSQTDLASRLKVPLGTVKARTRRGLLALRGRLTGLLWQKEGT
jgi:RNA polymerase sigma-70 factor (ECF subfamily)